MTAPATTPLFPESSPTGLMNAAVGVGAPGVGTLRGDCGMGTVVSEPSVMVVV
jgi:hypothetical protein